MKNVSNILIICLFLLFQFRQCIQIQHLRFWAINKWFHYKSRTIKYKCIHLYLNAYIQMYYTYKCYLNVMSIFDYFSKIYIQLCPFINITFRINMKTIDGFHFFFSYWQVIRTIPDTSPIIWRVSSETWNTDWNIVSLELVAVTIQL